MTIYLDIVLLENICMNYIILYATGIIYKAGIKSIRLIVSSLIGGVYAIVSYIDILGIYSNIVLKIILSIAMVYIAFSAKTIKVLARQVVLFYLTSFAFGGVAFALLYFVKPQDILMKNGIYIGMYPLKIVMLGAIIGFIIITTAFKMIKGKISRKDMFCEITLGLNGKKTKVIAMIDTGNLLKEPITGLPVIVVEKTSLKELFPEQILNNLQNIMLGENVENLDGIEKYMAKIRAIPFTSLGKQNGMLLGFKLDYISICAEEKDVLVPEVIVGIYENSLTKNGLYTALIGLEILERSEYKNEPIGIT